MFKLEDGKAYTCTVVYRSSASQRVYFGFKCFDKDMEEIQPKSYYRVENSNVVFESFDANTGKLAVSQENGNLEKWNKYVESAPEAQNFSFLRVIGIYNDLDYKTQRPKPKDVLNYPGGTYDTNPLHSLYSSVDTTKGEIQLTEAGVNEVKRYLASGGSLIKGKTVLMNHTSGSTFDYIFAEPSVDNTEWREHQVVIGTQSTQFVLRTGTKYIQPIILANYNHGYQGQAIANPQAILDWKQFSIQRI